MISRYRVCAALLAVMIVMGATTDARAEVCQTYLNSGNASFNSGQASAKAGHYAQAARHFMEAGKAYTSLRESSDCIRTDKNRAMARKFIKTSRVNYISTRRSSFVVEKMKLMKKRPWDFELFISNLTLKEIKDSDIGKQYTLLTHAVSAGNINAVKALVKKRVDVNIANPDGSTPLYWAQSGQHDEIAGYLIKHGARDERVIALRAWNNGEYRKADALINRILGGSEGRLNSADSSLLIKAIEAHYLARRGGLPQACNLLDRAKMDRSLDPDMAWGAFLCKNLKKSAYYADRAAKGGAMDIGFALSVSGHLALCSGNVNRAMDKYAQARSKGRGVTDEFPYVRSVCPGHNRALENIEGRLGRLAKKTSHGK